MLCMYMCLSVTAVKAQQVLSRIATWWSNSWFIQHWMIWKAIWTDKLGRVITHDYVICWQHTAPHTPFWVGVADNGGAVSHFGDMFLSLEVMQLNVLHSNFLQKWKEYTKQAFVRCSGKLVLWKWLVWVGGARMEVQDTVTYVEVGVLDGDMWRVEKIIISFLLTITVYILARQPSAGFGLLVHEVSWSHTTTCHSR
jgi:hypothetical protein